LPVVGGGGVAFTRRWAQHKGHCYRANPPTVEDIVAVMRAAGDGRHAGRRRGLIVVLWRAAHREALAQAIENGEIIEAVRRAPAAPVSASLRL
jgi:hypothetical protein